MDDYKNCDGNDDERSERDIKLDEQMEIEKNERGLIGVPWDEIPKALLKEIEIEAAKIVDAGMV